MGRVAGALAPARRRGVSAVSLLYRARRPSPEHADRRRGGAAGAAGGAPNLYNLYLVRYGKIYPSWGGCMFGAKVIVYLERHEKAY